MQGCNDYTINLETNKTTEKVTISSVLQLYEHDVSGMITKKENVLGRESENFDKIIVNAGDNVKFGYAQFDNKVVTILPKYSDQYVQSLISYADQIKNESAEQQAKLLAEKGLTQEQLDLVLSRLTSSENEKNNLQNLINQEKNKNLAITIIIIILVVIVLILMFILIFRRKKKRKR